MISIVLTVTALGAAFSASAEVVLQDKTTDHITYYSGRIIDHALANAAETPKKIEVLTRPILGMWFCCCGSWAGVTS